MLRGSGAASHGHEKYDARVSLPRCAPREQIRSRERPLDFDTRLRLAVFDRISQLRRASGGLVSARDLSLGIEFEGQHVPIWNQQRGIYRPAGELQRPLLYLVGIRPGEYDPLFPAYIVADDPATLTAHVSIGAPITVREPLANVDATFAIERRYHTIAVKQRLHQRKFRELVLSAYRERCAMCSRGHTPLLNAAHILEDRDERGRPEVPNGVALCKIHHSAYDANILGISPDYLVHVKEAVLSEHDGPMLRYGLQALQHQRIWVPNAIAQRPRADYLADRFERFRAA